MKQSLEMELENLMKPEQKILAAASAEYAKYYLAEEFTNELPKAIQDAVRVVCVVMAQKLNCVFTIGFQEDGDIYFQTFLPEGTVDFDEIGAELEVKQLKKEKEELWKALRLWYVVYKTQKGERLRRELIRRQEAIERMQED